MESSYHTLPHSFKVHGEPNEPHPHPDRPHPLPHKIPPSPPPQPPPFKPHPVHIHSREGDTNYDDVTLNTKRHTYSVIREEDFKVKGQSSSPKGSVDDGKYSTCREVQSSELKTEERVGHVSSRAGWEEMAKEMDKRLEVAKCVNSYSYDVIIGCPLFRG